MNPRVLILDDATASVDAKTERLIQQAMHLLCAGRTTFVIAPRFSTVKHADLVLVLKDGRIVERGRHEELIRDKGFYREIFDQQIKQQAKRINFGPKLLILDWQGIEFRM